MKSIYTVTAVCTTIQNIHPRCFGFYFTKAKALHAVKKDYGSMNECLFDHLVIEEFTEGIIATATQEIWFKWDHPNWVPCEKPKSLNGCVSFGIG